MGARVNGYADGAPNPPSKDQAVAGLREADFLLDANRKISAVLKEKGYDFRYH